MMIITLKKKKKNSTNSSGGVSQPTTPPAHPVRTYRHFKQPCHSQRASFASKTLTYCYESQLYPMGLGFRGN